MASYPKSAFLLQLPPTQQELSYGPEATFFLVGSPNRQWKIGPGRDWFVAQQPEPRTSTQLAGIPSPQDVAQADWVIFFLDTNRTATYRVAADGLSYVSAAGGGGGATAYAQLIDKASIDLTTVNTPLATALSALATAISNKTSSLSGATDVVTYDLTTHNTPLASALSALTTAIAGKISALASASDYVTAPLATANTSLVNALAAAAAGGVPVAFQTITPSVTNSVHIAINRANGSNATLNPPVDNLQPVDPVSNMGDGQDMQVNMIGGGGSGLWTLWSSGSPGTLGYVFLSGVAPTAPALSSSYVPIYMKRRGAKIECTVGPSATV